MFDGPQFLGQVLLRELSAGSSQSVPRQRYLRRHRCYRAPNGSFVSASAGQGMAYEGAGYDYVDSSYCEQQSLLGQVQHVRSTMKTMFVGGFGAAGHSYWMGQTPLVPIGPGQRPGPVQIAPAPSQAVPVGAPVAPYTIPVINQQVPGTILGLPAKTVVIGGAVIVGGIILMHVL